VGTTLAEIAAALPAYRDVTLNALGSHGLSLGAPAAAEIAAPQGA
jgi:hypothetical protein